ncbi:cobalamin biosynthesis protein CobQ [Candidatus Gottesmanbacteria bacterium]|nr:cobalamin biosynthesis protein CobQ [Candidatus Gottesmanbacteria bacterium]
MKYSLTVAWLYPDLMSTYGDRGNIICLTKRCQWRGIEVKVIPVTLETSHLSLLTCHFLFMGGAQDRQQKLVAKDFIGKKSEKVIAMVEKGIPALFVCAAYQFVGHYYKPYQGAKIPGAGIFDLYTEHPGDQTKRLIGNVVAELNPKSQISMTNQKTIVGFENHGGRTYLGPKMKPLAKVIKGFGNNGEDGFEGAVYKNAIGSYFHGPLLPKNPTIADWLITKALEKKHGEQVKLQELDDTIERQAHESVMG